ncbi:MAG: hypothetical protein WCP46_00610 [Alphaproteobacteria bacterium]
MAIQTIPGLSGFTYARVASMDKRAVGKLTDTNHLESFHNTEPADYDKKIISLYTQSSLYSNDFLDMINKSKPFYISNNSDAWKWDVQVPYKFPKIIEVPTRTTDLSKPGIDGQEFWLVLDTNEFSKNSVVSVGTRQYGPRFYAIADPVPFNAGFLYTFTLVSENPTVDFVPAKFLQVGLELELIDGVIGEFDQDLLGLPRLGEKITMFESLSSGYGFEHKITEWADDRMMKDASGKALDILVYAPQRRNEMPLTRNDVKWEPFIEFWMRKSMLELKVKRMIWGKPGTVKSSGSKQEVKRLSAGVYHRMRNNGNLVQYNRGEFSANLLRSVFGDLFYRRVDVKDRRVKMYTNEAGFDVFQQALKSDALNSGLTIMADGSPKYIQGEGQHLTYNWAFDSMVTRETGKIELVHLKELDLPQTNLEFGQNKKSTPVFFVFDVSPTSDGSMVNNIREVRMEGAPSMTWGYIDGTRHHLGFAKSQGMSSASKFPGYEIWMKDRCDVFIEDLSRTVLIEEIPQF